MLFLLSFTVTLTPAQVTPSPEPRGYRGSSQALPYGGAFSDLANEVDAFWASTFRDVVVPYTSPNIFVVEQEISTGCGVIRPEPNAFYCGPDRTIYLVPQFLVDQERRFGDYAPIAVLSHEWGHHIQTLLAIVGPTRKDVELQADCLTGVFTRHADEQELLDYGDFLEALDSALAAGDAVFLPEDFPGAHGMAEDRVKALTKGYGGGPVAGCGLAFPPPRTPTPSPWTPTPPLWTPTPVPRTPTPTSRTPIPPPPPPPAVCEENAVACLLPASLPLPHTACFRIENDRVLTFDDLLANFSGTYEARDRLQNWGWQGSANRIFACDAPPEGEAGWVDISLHLFADAASAQEAVDYFAAIRAEDTMLVSAAPPAIGDHAAALSGPATNGKEFTLYVSQGPLLIRVTGVSPSGIPFINVLTVAQAILSTLPRPAPIGASPAHRHRHSSPATSFLPAALSVRHSDCFQVFTQGTYTYAEIVAALQEVGLSQGQVDGLGWQDGAFVVFRCTDPPSGRASQIDVVVHQFRDPQAAQQALPSFDSTYVPGVNEVRDCERAGPVLVCVTGRSLSGSPLSDVQFVLQQVVASAS